MRYRCRAALRAPGFCLLGALLLGALSLPASVRAGTSPAPPAAISFNLTGQATLQATPFNITASGVANQNGDMQATLMYGGHSFGLISVGGLTYQDEDGGAYRASGAAGSASSGGQAGVALTPSCVASQIGLGTLFRQALTGQGAGSALGLQDLGPVTVGGQQAEHLQGTLNLGSATLDPQIMQALSPLITGCDGGSQQAAAFLPLVLAVSQMSVDADVDPATGVPLQFDLHTTVPLIGADIDLSGQMMPLSSPATITPPS